MMEMDGRDSAECQNWEKRDKIGIIGIDLSHKMTKVAIVSSLPMLKEVKKREMQGEGTSRSKFEF